MPPSDWITENSGSSGSPHLNARSSVPSEAGKSSSSHMIPGWNSKKALMSLSSSPVANSVMPVHSASTEGMMRGHFFPSKVAVALGTAKLLVGMLLIALGALALWGHAAMSNLGSGLWCGAVVMISGVMGIMAGKRKHNVMYVICYLILSILALSGIGLLLIFAATGLSRDSDSPWGYHAEQEWNSRRESNQVQLFTSVPSRQRLVIINAALVAFGTLEAILSLASIFICAREACMCYAPLGIVSKTISAPNVNLLATDPTPDGQARAYRLLRWIGQHRHPHHPLANRMRHVPLHHQHHPPPPYIPPVHPRPHPIFRVPVVTAMGPQGPYPSFLTGAPTAYMMPQMLPPLMNMHSYAGYVPVYSLSMPPSMQASEIGDKDYEKRQQKKERRRRRRSGRQTPDNETREEVRENDNGDNISFVYTGLDREIAEEFILHSMEPSKSMIFNSKDGST